MAGKKVGRKPLPSHLIKRGGRRQPSDLGLEAPSVVQAAGTPPFEWLDGCAQSEWRRVMDLPLIRAIVTDLDLIALAAYCTTVSIFRRAHVEIGSLGGELTMETKGDKGQGGATINHPLIGIQRRAGNLLINIAAEFGMTAVARSTVEFADDAQDDIAANENSDDADKDAGAVVELPVLPPPDYLNDGARAEWFRVVGSAVESKVLRGGDEQAFSVYCSEVDLFISAHKELCASLLEASDHGVPYGGLLIPTKRGNWKHNPVIGTQNTSIERVLGFAQDFGLTPSARRRIKIIADPKENPYARWKRDGSVSL